MGLLSSINDYYLRELVAEGKETSVYRAERKTDNAPVIIKLIKAEHMALKEVQQLTHEYELISKLNSPYILRPQELISHQNNIFMVMEDFNGISLSHLIQEHTLDLLQSLDIAINVASALGDIHHQNIIHKDIKPDNILVNAETKNIKIIDFSLATQLSREMQTGLNPEQLKGSIAYMSPEQTGRMNRSVDFRSDIYSLGVTLYELFVSKLPFEADSSYELIHMHIAQQPISPSDINIDIPKMLSDIILKCMSKGAEFRYHSAFGLRYDLEKCRENIFRPNDEDSSYEIGTRDIFDHFNMPEKLYGRAKELNFINRCFKEVWSGASLLLTLSGYSGVGKSSLVFEAQKHLPPGSGRFAYAKFDQFKHSIPYHGLIQAFQVVIHQLLTEPDEILQEWKERILEGVGNSGKILIDVIPEIELVIGEQAEMEKASPQETANRFNFVMVNFLKALLQPDSPLVLFIDDLHWADEPSLKLLELFFSNPKVNNFLIIATYRDNEVTPFHPLAISLKEIASYGSKVINLPIGSLSPESIQEMIQDTFFGPPKQAQELTQLLYRKTEGNPFFTLQFLKLLYEKELFFFDKTRGVWWAQLDAIAASQVSDNVADLVAAKLKSLPPEVIEVLSIGAMVENRFDLELLSQVSSLPREIILQALSIAMQGELISQEKQQLAFTGPKRKKDGEPQEAAPQVYRFLHDRIQQAANNLLSDEERSKIHYKIGSALLRSTTSSGKISEKSIDIVNHLNAANPAFLTEEDKVNLIQLNLTAGHKAKDSAAYHSAIEYFSKGISLLSPDSWDNAYGLTADLHKNLALCLMISGGIEHSQGIFDLCLSKSKTILEKAELYQDLIFLYSQVQQYGTSLDIATKALKLFKYDFSIHPSKFSLMLDFAKLKFKMRNRQIEELEKIPEATDQNVLAILNIHASILYPAMVIGNKPLFVKTSLTLVDLSWKYGISKHAAPGLVCLGMILGSEMFKDYEACYRYGTTSFNIAHRFPKSADAAGALYLYYSFTHRWKNPLRTSILPLKQNFRKVLETGVSTIAAANAVYINLIALLCGERLNNVLEGILESLVEIKKFSSKSEEMSLMVHREVCLSLKGNNKDPSDPRPPELTDSLLEDSRTNNQYVLFSMRYDVWHMILLYYFGKYKEAIKIGESCLKKIHSFPNWIETHAFYYFYTLSLCASLKTPKDNSAYWKQIKSNFKILKRWATATPINYLHYKLLVEAEMSRIQGSKASQKIYVQAIEAAKTNGAHQDIGIAYELFGSYYQQQDFKEISSMLYHKALQYYTLWGAEAKCAHFKKIHADQLTLETLSLTSTNIQDIAFPSTDPLAISSMQSTAKTDSGTIRESSDFDVNTLIDASQALSKEIVLDKLMESLMHVVMVNAGADKAFLILYENKKGRVYSQTFINQKYTPLISPVPVEEMGDHMCLSAIKYVTRTHKEILLNNATEEGNFGFDPYIINNRPKSLLCLPLVQKGILTGVLYLENTATKNAFTPKLLRLLSLLSSQIVISIENAQFYAKMESKVRERTKELQGRNQELQEALQLIKTVQGQMIQKEKLASLGLLTSGIAHELKNPLNFVINFAMLTQDCIKDFLAELRKIDKVDHTILDSFEQEVFQSLQKVDSHGRRADKIIKGMLAHAHQGSKSAEPVEINSLMEQALNLTYYNAHKKDQVFNVLLEKHFDPELKTITGFPGDLIRIFINIFDNAFYAQGELFKLNKNYVPTLMVKTELKENEAIITIRDNGPGIPQEVIAKIFQPFFTTKPTGIGTGLGLSIVYDIVTKQHSGSINVTSEKGKFTEFVIRLPAHLKSVSSEIAS